MRRKVFWIILAGVGLLAFLGEAGTEPQEDSFLRAVDLDQYRKGNPEWDTQELISSGLTALHGEHVQILKELRALKAEVARLEKSR